MPVIPGTPGDLHYDTRPEVDLIDGHFYADRFHAATTWMRANDPFYRDEANQLTAVTRHADIMAISKNSAVFRNGGGFRPDSPPLPMMISMDRPQHMVRRNLVNRGFTPRRVSAFEPRVREICTGIIDQVIERGECDFVRDIAAPLPLIVIGDLLGVEEKDHDHLLRWSDDLMNALGSTDPEKLQKQVLAFTEYQAYHQRVVADRRSKPPGDDLMSILVHAEIDGERLDDESILQEALLILIGGDETTRHVVSGGMEAMLRDPVQWQKLVDEPDLIPRAIEEMLRWVTPIQNMMRTAAEPCEVNGYEVAEGERLLLLYPSANRDEAVFSDPFRFDVERHPNPHVAFGGYGAHFCLGNSLARLELRVMFEELAKRLPQITLASEEAAPLRPANFVVGIEALPVRFEPGRSRNAA